MTHKGEDFYELYAQSVYRYLFSLIGEADTAEELTQETFYQALKSIDTYRGESTPQVWLCAIAKRLWFKELEHRKRTLLWKKANLLILRLLIIPRKSLRTGKSVLHYIEQCNS